VPPEVSYVNGQLLINARNSTLSDVLKAVEKDTVATFDISSGDTSERVVAALPRHPPRRDGGTAQRLAFQLRNAQPDRNPSALSKVLLTPRSKGSAGQTYTAQQQPPQTFQQPMQISPGLPIQQQVQQQNAAAENPPTTATPPPTRTLTTKIKTNPRTNPKPRTPPKPSKLPNNPRRKDPRTAPPRATPTTTASDPTTGKSPKAPSPNTDDNR